MSKRPVLSLTIIVLSLFICCGATNGSCNDTNNNFKIGPSGGEIAGVAIGVGAAVTAVVLIEVNHSHHTLKGCLFDSPGGGLQLRTEDLKDYTLAGSTTNLAVGNSVRLHGDREKRDKNAPVGQVFRVKELKKNYGPCTVLAASVTSPGVPPSSPKSASLQSQTHP